MGFFAARKQAVGVGAAAAVGGTLAATGVGLPLAPLGAALAYLAGAALTPAGTGGGPVGPTSAETVRALPAELRALSDAMSYKAGKLPADVNAQWDRVKVALRAILERQDQLATSPHQTFVVTRSIRDYVPTSVDAFLALPAGEADTRRVRGGRTAHQELAYQMTLLADELEQVRAAVVQGDAQALADHGRFLDDKFASSRLSEPPTG